jgi:hypothetical protein
MYGWKVGSWQNCDHIFIYHEREGGDSEDLVGSSGLEVERKWGRILTCDSGSALLTVERYQGWEGEGSNKKRKGSKHVQAKKILRSWDHQETIWEKSKNAVT